MKRTLTLKIGGMSADLDTKALVLFNYTAERMDSPAAVKNSYSQQVTLPGTPGNSAIFGRFWRADRRTKPVAGEYTGIHFNALKRTPFAIMADGEIIEAGYCKLDTVTRRGDLVTGYAVTLYGGLGSFYYSLAYSDANDGKKTLADLVYAEGDTEYDLDFDINAAAVAAAWNRIANPDNTMSRWDVINFAPTYGGLPAGTFDASKALIKPADLGLDTDVEGAKPAAGGWSLCDLGEDRTEWETKDLRSYLQRPVLSVKKLIDACCNPLNNGGHTVVLDPAFFNAENPYYEKAWLTLPRLDSLTLPVEHDAGTFEINPAPVVIADYFQNDPVVTGSAAIGNISNGTLAVNVRLSLEIQNWLFSAPAAGTPLYLCSDYQNSGVTRKVRNGFWLQLVIRDANNNAVAVSKAMLVQSEDKDGNIVTPESFAEASGFVPVSVSGEVVGLDTVAGRFLSNGSTAPWDGPRIELSVEATILEQIAATVELRICPTHAPDENHFTGPVFYLYRDRTQNGNPYDECTDFASVLGLQEYTADTLTEVHTGSHITKQTLLSTEATPADYLFSYCKLFGLKFMYDKDAGVVHILRRETFYNGDTMDIDARVDRARDLQTVPRAVTAKWYDFGLDTAGAYAEYYEKIRGRVYGTQRVNTGFDFDANSVDVLSDNIFHGAAEVLEQNKLFCNPVRSDEGVTYPMPAAFLAGGCEYTLYGNNKETSVPATSAATEISYLNAYRGYDAVTKAQFHDDDNKGTDGDPVLLFFRGMINAGGVLSRYGLTDDTWIMATLNGGTPCWVLEPGDGTLSMPSFGRYLMAGDAVVHSWDFGRPAEVDIPEIEYPAGTEIYARYWAAFIADRYHVDTRVVTAWIDWRGIKVDEELMRCYFRFDGALWMLSKIIDYDIVNGGLTKCEFVKTQGVADPAPEPEPEPPTPPVPIEGDFTLEDSELVIDSDDAAVDEREIYLEAGRHVTLEATADSILKAYGVTGASDSASLYMGNNEYGGDGRYRRGLAVQAALIDPDGTPVGVSRVLVFTADFSFYTSNESYLHPENFLFFGNLEPVVVGEESIVLRSMQGGIFTKAAGKPYWQLSEGTDYERALSLQADTVAAGLYKVQIIATPCWFDYTMDDGVEAYGQLAPWLRLMQEITQPAGANLATVDSVSAGVIDIHGTVTEIND